MSLNKLNYSNGYKTVIVPELGKTRNHDRKNANGKWFDLNDNVSLNFELPKYQHYEHYKLRVKLISKLSRELFALASSGISRKDLAKSIEVSPATVSNIINMNTKRVSLNMLLKVADAISLPYKIDITF